MAGMIKDRITSSQMVFILFAIMVGVGILSLPQTVADKAGVDGWIAIITGGLLAILSALLMTKLGTRFQTQSVMEYAPHLLGRFFGTIISILFVLYFIAFVGMVVRISADVTKLFLLDETPVEVIVISMLLMGIYLVQHGMNPIARFNECIQPLTVFLLVFVLLFTIPDAEYGRNLPVLGDGLMPVWKSIPTTFFSYLGYEIIIFLLPFMKKPERGSVIAIGTIVAVMLLYVVIIVSCVGVLGVKEVLYVNYPLISIIKNIEVPGGFLERLDAVMMLVWVPFAITTVVLYHYCASLITAQLVKLQEHRVISLFYFPIVFLVALLPKNVMEASRWSNSVSIAGMALNLVVPVILWAAYFVKRKKERV